MRIYMHKCVIYSGFYVSYVCLQCFDAVGWAAGRASSCKNWVVGCWHDYLGWGADLHMAQQMPLPLTISCSSKSRLVLPFLILPFWYLLTQVVPDKFQKSSMDCVSVCVYVSTVQCHTKLQHGTMCTAYKAINDNILYYLQSFGDTSSPDS